MTYNITLTNGSQLVTIANGSVDVDHSSLRNGQQIASGNAVNYNGAWASSGYVAFFVPPGATYEVRWAGNTGSLIWYETN